MRKINRLKGVLIFRLYTTKKRIVPGLVFAAIATIFALIFGGNAAGFGVIFMIPWLFTFSMIHFNFGRWERYQITMPITRRQLLFIRYFIVLVAFLFSAVFLCVLIGINSLIHTNISSDIRVFRFMDIPFVVGIQMMAFAISTPITCAKVSNLKQAMYSMGIMIFLMGAIVALSLLEPSIQLALVNSVVSLTVFMGSYFLSARLLDKVDF